MSMPTIPNITPFASVTREESILMLFESIAREEMALSHIINGEAEKLQYVSEILNTQPSDTSTLAGVMQVQESAYQVMNSITLKEIMLQLKLSDVKKLLARRASSTP